MNVCSRIISEVKQAVVGKDRVLAWVLTAILARGHILLEDIPGVGKTTIALAFARAMGLQYGRVQFTPDVLPSDITGYSVYLKETGEMRYQPGAVLCNLFLADELNRATSRTQSALLEAMEERQISVDGDTYPLGEDFIVMATQNPLESYGTFPLPEAQVDRFFMTLSLGYMTRLQEMQVLTRQATTDIIAEIQPVVTREETHYVKTHFREVEVGTDVRNYLMDLVEKTRKESQFISGVSTRGALALYKACQVNAAFAGRDYVLPEDIRDVARPVLGHRIFSGGGARAQEAELLLDRMIGEIPVPLEKK